MCLIHIHFVCAFVCLSMRTVEGCNKPGALATAASGLPDMGAAGEGTSVIPWLVGVTTAGAGLFGELALGVAEGTGLEVGATAAAAGMSYFCSCSRYVSAVCAGPQLTSRLLVLALTSCTRVGAQGRSEGRTTEGHVQELAVKEKQVQRKTDNESHPFPSTRGPCSTPGCSRPSCNRPGHSRCKVWN